MSKIEIQKNVLEIASTILGVGVGMETCRVNTPAWNSLKHMEIMFGIEEHFDVQFSESELTDLDSISKVVDLLGGKYAT
jgi:acyl carrier protein